MEAILKLLEIVSQWHGFWQFVFLVILVFAAADVLCRVANLPARIIHGRERKKEDETK